MRRCGAGAAADVEPVRPPSETEPPRFFQRSAREIERIAGRAEKVREERENGRLTSIAYTKGSTRWQVSYFRDGDQVVQVLVDDGTGAILEQWTGDQIAWTMARGYEGAFARKLNAPYVWIPLCLLFIAPFVDVRRPFRLLHLDLLVLLAFGVSHIFFNRGEIGLSVPLAYPVLLYLLARLLYAGFRPRSRSGPLVPHLPLIAVVLGLAFLVTFRIGLNVADSNVIDVGYAGVIGADRIVDGDPLYGEGFSDDVERGDTYGPVNYLFYVPFEQLLRWSGSWDDLPAAHGAAIAIDLLVIGGLLLLGRRLRPGPRGQRAGGGARLRLGGLSVLVVRARVELERLARGARVRRRRCSRSRWRGGELGGRLERRRDRARRRREVRAARAGAAVRTQGAALVRRGAAAHARGGDPAVRARWRAARAVRPDGRLPGVAALAVQHLGAGRSRSTGCSSSSRSGPRGWRCWWRSCRGGSTRARSRRSARRC